MQISTAGLQIHIIDDAQAGIMLFLDMVVTLLLCSSACTGTKTCVLLWGPGAGTGTGMLCMLYYTRVWLQTSFLDAFLPAGKSAFFSI